MINQKGEATIPASLLGSENGCDDEKENKCAGRNRSETKNRQQICIKLKNFYILGESENTWGVCRTAASH